MATPRSTRSEPSKNSGIAQFSGAEMRARLLHWFADEARDLPWRRTLDAYRIWVSEAMLQQTQVATVLGYYERFLERFPDVQALAAADDESLLAAWSGLGYYRRARSLRDAARAITAEHGGQFPMQRDAALALPGIGPYTAGAVLSIAYGRREALVDGNVARVFARVFELDDPMGSRALEKELWARAEALLPDVSIPGAADGPGAFNQALMELGATVCTPSQPRCLLCPIAAGCGALASGRVGSLPVPKPRKPAVPVELEVLLCRRPGAAGGRVLLERRPDSGRMAGMLELPTREIASSHLFAEAFSDGRLDAGAELGRVRHGITRYAIEAAVRAASFAPVRTAEPLQWAAVAELPELPLTGMAKKILSRAFCGPLLGR